MRPKLLWLIVVIAILVCAIYWYESSKSKLDIDPHAAEEIEKAKRR